MLLIPAIDLKEGKCVRLRQGRMDDDTVFSENPVEVAGRWVDAGAKRIHLVDLDGAFAGKPCNAEVVHAIAKAYPNLPVQIGGGIRDVATIEAYLNAGVQYVIIGTKAVQEPQFVREMATKFAGHVMVGLDAKDGKVATVAISETGTVNGNIQAQHVIVSGHVKGNIYSLDRVELLASAHIEGEITYGSIGIEVGAKILGKLNQVSAQNAGEAADLMITQAKQKTTV